MMEGWLRRVFVYHFIYLQCPAHSPKYIFTVHHFYHLGTSHLSCDGIVVGTVDKVDGQAGGGR